MSTDDLNFLNFSDTIFWYNNFYICLLKVYMRLSELTTIISRGKTRISSTLEFAKNALLDKVVKKISSHFKSDTQALLFFCIFLT